MFRTSVLLFASLVLAGCGTTADTVTVAGSTATVDTTSVGVSGPIGSVGAGVGVIELVPSAGPDPAARYFGQWSLARDGDRNCRIELGKPNAIGDYTARTSGCAIIELARIALWTPQGDGLVLYDFERRPVVTLTQSGNGLYDGPMWDNVRVTLWR